MKLGLRLLLAPACGIVLLLGAGWLSFRLQVSAADDIGQLHKQQGQIALQLHGAETRLRDAHTSAYRKMSIVGSLDDAAMKKFLAGVDREVAQVRKELEATGLAGEANSELGKASAEAVKLVAEYAKQVAAAMDMASVDPNTGVAAMQTADATFVKVSKAMEDLVRHYDAQAQQQVATARASAQRTQALVAVVCLLLAGAVVGVIWALQRRIVRELARIGHAAQSIADGDLTIELDSSRRDEIGDLMRSMGVMARQLATALGAVKASADSVRTASSEIASGNADLSTRTEVTAGRLQETASSMSDLSTLVNRSAESSSTASEVARSAAAVAQRGGEAVGHIVTTMEDIHASSRKIADIIGVIDGIAFQTNILALNAAVEAARAGEQGRGFAVVAGEVRLLAQRSAEAAREIKNLIGASVDKVENGSRLVRGAGETIGEVVQSAQRVATLISEVNATASEQSGGISQVTGAINQLDQMTQQNAALVEQSAAAASSLSEQATRLAEVVSRFRLNTTNSAANAVRASAPPASPRPSVRETPAAAAPARAPSPARPAAPAHPATATTADDWETF